MNVPLPFAPTMKLPLTIIIYQEVFTRKKKFLPDKFWQLVSPPPSLAGVLPQGEGELEGREGLGVTVDGRNKLTVSLRLVINVQ